MLGNSKPVIIRFGSLPDTARQRIATATLDQLEHWAGQVLDAPTLEAIVWPMAQ